MENELTPWFLALVELEEDERYFDVHFVNNTEHDLRNVRYVTGGTMIFGDEVHKTTTAEKEFGDLAPFATLIIDQTDVFELDDTFIAYKLLFDIDGKPYRLATGIPTYTMLTGHWLKRIPLLNKSGYVFDAREE